MTSADAAQQAHAERDAYVAGRDIKTFNYYGRNPEEDHQPPFLVVDPAFLAAEQQKPSKPYIARPPLWADVVHGQNADARFLEREQFSALLAAVRTELLEPLRNGSDRRLRTLFVTGAPGCGKSTLVRHAAATLVGQGDVVVADLGVNHGRLIADDLDAYLRGLTGLAESGKPVLLLMDDPFFANSGWDLLLETLARPSYAGIAVLGASPTYLYETYGRPLSGRQVVLKSFALGATTNSEREVLAEMYGVRDRPDIDRAIGRHEDLLVFAMETASGSSFNEIIGRIWVTLNDGRPMGPRSVPADAEWPVIAFLLTSYLHRHYVTCPESLLRTMLTDLAGDAGTDYVRELSELTLGEGWHIFRVSPGGQGANRAMIGTMHARVAERAWEVRPFKPLNPVDMLARASVRAPECAVQLAEFILTCQSLKDPAGRSLAVQLAEQWRDGVSTAQLSTLVRGLRASPAAKHFRGLLRDRQRMRDSQSWLAAAELIRLERYGSKARAQLTQTDLPYLLRVGDLSADSAEAIEQLGRGSRRRDLAETLCASLRGELGWELDSRLLTWLLGYRGEPGVHSLLPPVYDWLDGRPDEERARVALIEWHAVNAAALGPADFDDLLDQVKEWIDLLPDSRQVVSAFFALASALLAEGRWMSPGVVEEMSSWVETWPHDSFIRERYLSLLTRHYAHEPAVVADAVSETLAWLTVNPQARDVRRALLWLVLAGPALPPAADVTAEAFTWLAHDPTDSQLRLAWTRLVEFLPALAVGQVLDRVLEWLGDHQEVPGGRQAAQALVRALHACPEVSVILGGVRRRLALDAEDAVARAGFLCLAREFPCTPQDAEVIGEARRWVLSHPEDTRLRGAFLQLLQARPEHANPGEITDQMIAWLAGRPDDGQGRTRLLGLAGARPGSGEAVRALEHVTGWLDGQRGDDDLWIALFGLAGASPGQPRAPEICTAARRWLGAHPEDSHVRSALLAFVRSLPGPPQADELIGETLAWLDRNPGALAVRAALSRLVQDQRGTTVVGEYLARARARVSGRPDDPAAREWIIALVRDLAEPAERAGVITETREWLETRQDDGVVWTALLSLIVATPGYPDGAGVLAEARQWIAAHPDDRRVRAGLLGYLKACPGPRGAVEVIADTVQWLAGHGNDDQVRAALLALQHGREADLFSEGLAKARGIEAARTYLAEFGWDRNARVRLMSMVRASTDRALLAEVIAETRRYLEDHPEDAHTYQGLLWLLRAHPWHPDLPGVIKRTSSWLAGHPDNGPVRAGLVSLVALRPEDLDVADVIAQTISALREHPADFHTWPALLALIARHPGHAHAAEGIAQARDWLDANRYRAESPQVKAVARSLLQLTGVLGEALPRPETDALRSWLDEQFGASAAADRQANGKPRDSERLHQELAWLREHPDDAGSRVQVVSLVAALPGHPGAADVVTETHRWLAERPGEAGVRAALFRLCLLMPEDPLAAEIVSGALRWLMGHPVDPRFRMGHFIAALSEVPDHWQIPGLIGSIRARLEANPDDIGLRRSLFKLATLLPYTSATDEIISDGRLWLLEHDDDPVTRMSLLSLVRSKPGYAQAGDVLSETRAWLSRHPESEGSTRTKVVVFARAIPDAPGTIEVARETRDWLRGHPEESHLRFVLLGLARVLPDWPGAVEYLAETRDWLAAHPQATSVREALLAAVRDLPGASPLIDGLLQENREWLAKNPGGTNRGNVPTLLLELARKAR